MNQETNEATGVVMATETVDSSEGGTTALGETNNVIEMPSTAESTTDAGGFIRTESAPAEVPKQLKHRGTITGIVALTAKTENRGIELTAHSDSNGRDYKQTIWPPRQWTDNVFITGEELQAFPAPEGVTAAGNPKQTPYQRFGRTISSTDGRAELQRIISAGTKAGRVLNGNYTNFDSLVENLNSGLAGTPVIFTTGADGDPDPEYGFRIKVKSVMPFDVNFDKLKPIDASGN